jgi:hypothetical protein
MVPTAPTSPAPDASRAPGFVGLARLGKQEKRHAGKWRDELRIGTSAASEGCRAEVAKQQRRTVTKHHDREQALAFGHGSIMGNTIGMSY